LDALQAETFKPYDLKEDVEGLYRWLEAGKQLSKYLDSKLQCLKSDIPLTETIRIIIEEFKTLIEEEESWRLFWTQFHKKPKHVKEFYSQMLFYMVSTAWLSAKIDQIIIEKNFNKETKQL